MDRIRQYVKEHAGAIGSRRSGAPVIVVLDWDAASKTDSFSKLVKNSKSYKVLAWPVQALNPKVEASFRGIERAHSDRVLEDAISRGAQIGRKSNGNYIVQVADYGGVKQKIAEIVRQGLQPDDFEHAKPFIQHLLQEAGAA